MVAQRYIPLTGPMTGLMISVDGPDDGSDNGNKMTLRVPAHFADSEVGGTQA